MSPVDPTTLVQGMTADVPFALLPVRIETRFRQPAPEGPEPEPATLEVSEGPEVPRPASEILRPEPESAEPSEEREGPRPHLSGRGRAGLDLLVRIYPDQIHQDTHEPKLTPEEEDWGEHFWRERSSAAGDASAEREVWLQLARRFGPPRAAWIARALNPADPLKPGYRQSSWARAPEARLLPDRFAVLGYTRGTRVFAEVGAPIPATLPTGPSPTHKAVTVDGLELDEGMQWMVDFEEAVKLGMGIIVPLPARMRWPLSRLVVLGVRAGKDAEDEAQALATLLEAHRHSDGLGLVAPGTPTNNTEQQRAGRDERGDPFQEGELLADDLAAQAPEAGSDGFRLATALGIDSTTLLDVPGAHGLEHEIAGLMQRALWPALGGYFLEHVLDGATTAQERGELFEAIVARVRGRGPLVTLRAGSQPYGLLPVSALTLWDDRDTPVNRRALRALQAAREMWEASVAHVPRVGGGGDPDDQLLAVLGMDATSQRTAARPMYGPLFLDNAYRLVWGPTASDRGAQRQAVEGVLGRLGLTTSPRLARSLYAQWDLWLRAPRVQRGGTSEQNRLDPNYIDWLASHTFDEVRDERGAADPQDRPFRGSDESPPLFYLLLRHSLLLAWSQASFQVLLKAGKVTAADRRPEPELVGMDPLRPTRTALDWPRLDVKPGVTALEIVTAQGRMDRMLEDIRTLAGLPTAALERLFAEALDLHATRLDAWITALVTKRLDAMRASRDRTVFLGAYGWVESLSPRPELLRGPGGASSAPSGGYVHAPSLDHATTAAILRSAYLTHGGPGDGDTLALDLSSRRVRRSRWLLDALRQGQSLSELLGYRFERALHERGRDNLIAGARRAAPIVAGKLMPAASKVEAGAARNVVDGLALLRRHQKLATPSLPWNGDLPARSSADGKIVEEVLDELADLLDAVSDVLTAESVFQATRGNHLRSGASLDALGRGEAPPPELEFLRTFRSGAATTHRVGWLRAPGDDPAAIPGWEPSDGRARPRAAAQPELSAIAAELLPQPADVRWRADYSAETATPRPATKTFTLSDLDLSPLDVVYAAIPTDAPAASEFEQRAVLHARREAPEGAERIALRFERDPSWKTQARSLGELLEIARAVRELITEARALDARDLALPGTDTAPGIDTAALRVGCVVPLDAALSGAERGLTSALSAGDPDQLEAALLQAAEANLSWAIPVEGDERASNGRMEELATDALAELGAAKTALQAVSSSGDEGEIVAAVHGVLGESFRVLLPVDPGWPSGSLLDRTTALLGGDAGAIPAWLERMARVRDGVDRLQIVRLYAAAQAAGKAPDVSVGQLPEASGEPWVALETGTADPPPGGRVSLAFAGASGLALDQTVTGLLIDEWVEVVPGPNENTGVAFHHDAPGSCAPQSILLAVPPDARPEWDFDLLETIVFEALELAKLRMVDLDALRDAGHVVPAAHIAFNGAGETISTSMNRAANP